MVLKPGTGTQTRVVEASALQYFLELGSVPDPRCSSDTLCKSCGKVVMVRLDLSVDAFDGEVQC